MTLLKRQNKNVTIVVSKRQKTLNVYYYLSYIENPFLILTDRSDKVLSMCTCDMINKLVMSLNCATQLSNSDPKALHKVLGSFFL